MRVSGILVFFVSLMLLIGLSCGDAKGKEYYRTFEVLSLGENSLTLRDGDGNVVEVEKDPKDYRVGYKVRYDSVRNRLRHYRWQDYTVTAITDDSITLQHKTGDILTLAGNYTHKYGVGDRVRYDSIGNKLKPDDKSEEWQQYTVVKSTEEKIILRSKSGQELPIYLDNNIYEVPRGLFIPKYKVGDPVRYNEATGQIRKDEKRTYDWQEFEITAKKDNQLILTNSDKEKLMLENTYNTNFNIGDKVKYDRLNDLLKKVR